MSGFTNAQSRQMIVPTVNLALYTGALYPGGGTIGVAAGQLLIRTKDNDGVVPLTALAPASVVAATGNIQIGAATSKVAQSNVNPMGGVQRFDESAFFGVGTVKTKVGEATMGALAITGVDGVFVPAAENEYGLGFQILSARNTREHTSAGDRIVIADKMPDNLATFDSPLSYMYANIVRLTNLQSDLVDPDGRREFTAFAVNMTGVTDVVGDPIVDVAVGDVLVTNNGAGSVTVTPLMKRSLKLFTDANPLYQDASFIPVVEDHGVEAGDDPIDGILVLANDQQDAIHNELLGSRVEVHVTPVYGFANQTALMTTSVLGSRQDVSKGDAWEKEFREGAFGKTGLLEVEGVTDGIVKRPSNIDKDKYYDCYTFYETKTEQTQTFGQRVEQVCQVLIPVTLTVNAAGEVVRTQDLPLVKADLDNLITALAAV